MNTFLYYLLIVAVVNAVFFGGMFFVFLITSYFSHALIGLNIPHPGMFVRIMGVF